MILCCRLCQTDSLTLMILFAVKRNGRFGWSTAVPDINADGLVDLAVGAPSVDSPSLSYHGAVYIYLSSRSRDTKHLLTSQPSVVIQCAVLTHLLTYFFTHKLQPYT